MSSDPSAAPEAVAAPSAQPPEPGTGWRTDDPLRDRGDDRLGRAAFATGVASAIGKRDDSASIVVGLFGPWGDGKTTVLNFIEQALADFPDIVVLRFNPWLIADERQLLPAFFEVIAAGLDLKLGGARRQIGDGLRKFSAVFSSVSAPVGPASVAGSGVSALAEVVAGGSLEDRRKDFEKLLRDAGKRIIVMLDDLDRLDDREIRAMFRLVRLAAPFDGITYVVACDDAVVADALRELHGGSGESGYSYLEKIVQVPLHIPPAPLGALAQMAYAGIETLLAAHDIPLTETMAREIATRYTRGAAPMLRTPRAVKRLLNALSFAMPLLKGEANVSDVVAVEAIHVAYPTLYRALRDHQEWFLRPQPRFALGRDDNAEQAAARDRIISALSQLSPEQQEAAVELLRSLFPAVNGLWTHQRTYGDEAVLLAEQRMASANYYDRYLSYALPVDDVSDRALDNAIGDPAEVSALLEQLLRAHGLSVLGTLIRKLDARLDQMPLTVVEALLNILPKLGHGVAGDALKPGILFGRSLLDDLVRLIARLVRAQPPASRLAFARRVIRDAVPLTFAGECLGGFSGSRSGERIFDQSAVAVLSRVLSARVRSELVTERPLWDTEPRWVSLLLHASQGKGSRTVRKTVAAWLADRPSDIGLVLTSVAGTAYSMDGGRPNQEDFTTASYETLASFLSPASARRAIRLTFGRIRAGAWPGDASESRDPTRTVVEQFVWVDARKRRAEGTPPSS